MLKFRGLSVVLLSGVILFSGLLVDKNSISANEIAQEQTQSGTELDTIAQECIDSPDVSIRTFHINWYNLSLTQQFNNVFPYKIRKGENLTNIAKKYNTSEATIMLLNGLTNNKTTEQQIIFIPNNSTVVTPVPTPASTSLVKVSEKEKKGSTTTVSQPKTLPKKPSRFVKGKVMSMRASAYGFNGNGKWGNRTASGTKVRLGVIAVDPRIIPLGTKVHVSGYRSSSLPAGGFVAIAEDTGGAIKGNRIDIYIPASESSSKVRNFGIQSVKITVLK